MSAPALSLRADVEPASRICHAYRACHTVRVCPLDLRHRRWRHPPGSGGGTVYIGSDDGTVTALDAATGRLRWTYTTGSRVDSSPAVAGGTVYAGSDDGQVYALDAGT